MTPCIGGIPVMPEDAYVWSVERTLAPSCLVECDFSHSLEWYFIKFSYRLVAGERLMLLVQLVAMVAVELEELVTDTLVDGHVKARRAVQVARLHKSVCAVVDVPVSVMVSV